MNPRWSFHSGQFEVWSAPERYKVIAAGRRWGKSELSVMQALKWAKKLGDEGEKQAIGWFIVPTYKIARPIWRKFERIAPLEWVTGKSGTEKAPDFFEIGNARIEFKTAENPESLIAEGLRWVIIDECGIVKEAVWEESIRPALIDFAAPGMFIGTPKGRNWFWRMFQRGRDPEDPEVACFGGPSFENPWIDKAEVDKLARDMPERTFRQEIKAEFLEGEGQVFRKVSDAVERGLERYPDSRGFDALSATKSVGIDLARKVDFTVLLGLSDNGAVTFMDRFKKIDWPVQKAHISHVMKGHSGAASLMDATGLGDPVFQDLAYENVAVEPFIFNHQSKINVIDALVLAFENDEIILPDDPVLVAELMAYEFRQTLRGVTYNAPEGFHDDCVIALALAWWNHVQHRHVDLYI